jgi:hypothetical protein
MPPRKSEPKTTRTIPKTETKKATKTTAKLKPPTKENLQLPPPVPARVFDDLVLSQAWMKPWIEAALITENSADACRQIGVSIADFTAARGSDHAFDALCRVYEEIVDVKIMNTLCSHAMRGEAHALALYYKQVRTLMIAGGAKASDQMLSASVVEAMIHAGLEAEGRPPALKPSQAKHKPTPETEED